MARCLLRLLALAGAFLAIAPAAQAAQCGLPDAAPWWIDFSDGSVSFRDSVFKHPGVIAASTGAQAPASLRAGGAQTVYWYMHLDAIVGSPAAPAPAASIPAAAAQLLAAAQASSGCTTPIIALNEMAGQDSPAPWSAGTTAYRDNILALVSALTAAGARPFLLVPGTPHPPNVAGAAAAWWQQLAQVSDIVLEVYASGAEDLLGRARCSARARCASRSARRCSPSSRSACPPAGSASCSASSRASATPGARACSRPTAGSRSSSSRRSPRARSPASSASPPSGRGAGGRSTARGADADKPLAACTYLWARDPVLCDVLAQVDGDFDGSLDEGQILLAAGVQCQIGPKETITTAAIDRLARLARGRQAGDRRAARARPRAGRKATAARRSGARRRRSSTAASPEVRPRYVAALARRGATPDVGRAAIADGLKLQTIERGLHVPAPTVAAVRAWRKAHGGTRVRVVTSSLALGWLGGSKRGIALPGSDVPPQVLRARAGQTLRVPTPQGIAHITVGEALPLRKAAGADANPAVSALIRATARDAAGVDVARRGRDEGARHARPACAISCRRRRRRTIAARAPFLRPLR